MLTIDVNAHVLETEQTWESMDGAERKYRPRIVASNNGDSTDEYWLVDGTLRLKSGNVGRNTPQAARELRDVPARLKHMDQLGVGAGKLGEDNIVIGSDYAHADSATELLAIHDLSADPRLTPGAGEKNCLRQRQGMYGL